MEEKLIGTRSPSGLITDETPIIPTEPHPSPTEVQDGASAHTQDKQGEGRSDGGNTEKPEGGQDKHHSRLDAINIILDWML